MLNQIFCLRGPGMQTWRQIYGGIFQPSKHVHALPAIHLSLAKCTVYLLDLKPVSRNLLSNYLKDSCSSLNRKYNMRILQSHNKIIFIHCNTARRCSGTVNFGQVTLAISNWAESDRSNTNRATT